MYVTYLCFSRTAHCSVAVEIIIGIVDKGDLWHGDELYFGNLKLNIENIIP